MPRVHQPVSGCVSIDATAAVKFGLESGRVYRIDIFHAERKKESSSLLLTLPSFDSSRSECKRL